MIDTLRIASRVFIPKGQRAKWFGLVVLALVVAGAEMLTAYLIFRVLGFATDPPVGTDSVDLPFGLTSTIGPLLVVAGVAFVLRGALATFNNYAQARVVQRAGAAVSARIHRRYLEAPYAFHLGRSSSESVRTVLWSVDQATQNALNPIITIFTQGLIAVALFGLLVGISPTLSIVAVVVVAGGLSLVLAVVQPRLGRLGALSEEKVKALLVSVRDSFDSVRDIKVYRSEAYFDARYRHHRDVVARIRASRALLDQIPKSALEIIVVVGLLLLIGLAQSDDSFSDFIPVLGALGYATLRIVPSLNKVVASANRLRYGQQAVENVQRDLDEAQPEERPADGPDGDDVHAPLFEDAIELEAISFSYPESDRPAVVDVDLAIRRGEMLAIAGGSGSGKSTLVDIVLGLLQPDTGRILVDGSTDLPPSWHRRVGVVSQSVVLLDASVRENVAFGAGRATDDDKVLEALDRAQLTSWLAGLPDGLDTMVGESGKLVSGGERQRVAIARSLYRDPQLLILDEATSALDGATEKALLEALRAISDGLTTIVVSHRMAPIEQADRVALLEDGRISALGTFEEVAASTKEFRDQVGQ